MTLFSIDSKTVEVGVVILELTPEDVELRNLEEFILLKQYDINTLYFITIVIQFQVLLSE